MNSPQQVDEALLYMLNDLSYFSRLRTCLQIRLADFAAQMCGFRSTRQIPDNFIDDVEDNYSLLLNELESNVNEFKSILSINHIYKSDILELEDLDLELLLEDILYEMTVDHSINIVNEYLFI